MINVIKVSGYYLSWKQCVILLSSHVYTSPGQSIFKARLYSKVDNGFSIWSEKIDSKVG